MAGSTSVLAGTVAPGCAARRERLTMSTTSDDQPIADEDILDAVLGGQTDCYAQLVDRYQRATWALAYRFIGNFDDARDVSQNAFVNAYRHARNFRRQCKFSTWLYRIVVNECKDWLRSRARRPRALPISPDDEDDDPSSEGRDPSLDPRELAANRELARTLSAAIGQLSEHQRSVFVLHHLHGMPLQEVADILGCRLGTVKAHLFRACERLRIRLNPCLREGM